MKKKTTPFLVDTKPKYPNQLTPRQKRYLEIRKRRPRIV